MDSKLIFTKALDDLTEILDSMSLYLVDCNMSVQSNNKYDNLEDLRSDAINGQAVIVFDVDCFIGNAAWRFNEDIFDFEQPEKNPSLSTWMKEVLNVEIGDIPYFKEEDETFDS